ncbi:MAG: MFS transporter [Pigmentiphaga sp.]
MKDHTKQQTGFLRENLRWIGGGFLLMFFSSFGQTFFVGLSGGSLRARFDLSVGQFGGLYMTATLASALTLPCLGRTLDLMPGWKVARFAIPGLAIACVLMCVAQRVAMLMLALYLLRLFGQGMMTEIAFTEVGRWFHADRGRAMALIVPGVQAGSALLPVTVVLVKSLGGWRMPWLSSAVLLMLVGYPLVTGLLRVERMPKSQEPAARGQRTARDWTRREVLRDPIFYLLLAGTLAPPFIGTTIFFHQSYLIAIRGYDPLVFSAAFPVMAVTTVLFGLLCGHLIDRFGALRLLPFFLTPLAVASATVGLVTPAWGIYLFMFLLGISNGFTQTLLGALWPEVYGLANLGGIRALIVSSMVLATAVGPGITGVLIDLGLPLPGQMLWMALWCVVASLAMGIAAHAVRLRECRT